MTFIFYITDSLDSVTAVVGTGADHSAAEAEAIAKWDAAISGRSDYAQRAPVVATNYSMLGSIDDVPPISMLYEIMGTDTDDTMPGLVP